MMSRLRTYQVCIQKWLDRCSVDCSFDTEPVTEGHPCNNYSCSRFRPVRIWSFYASPGMQVELDQEAQP